jgi:hypothetical protein
MSNHTITPKSLYDLMSKGILSGLIGAGLLHAGLSDSCMMGMCLAKMPWNQAKS